jgi:ATP-dependent Clp protease ATP-binding subunit ClpA
MSEQFTPEARGIVLMAHITARISVSQKVDAEDLLIGIMRENPAFLNRFLTTKITGDPFLKSIRQNLAGREEIPKLTATTPMPQRSEECERVIAMAREEADRAGLENIGLDHLLIAILREENSTAAKILRERGADIDLVRIQLAAVPYEPPSDKELKLRAFNRMANLLENSQPSESAKLAEFRNRLERSDGEDFSDLNDQMMEMMRERSATGDLRGKNSGNIAGSSTRLSETMRRLIFFAQFQARRFGSSNVETGHLLLVILREQRKHLSLFIPLAKSKEDVCTEIEQSLQPGENALPLEASSAATRPPLSEECQRAQAYAKEEAEKLWSSRIGPEHLLLGFLQEEGSFAAQIMRKYGADPEKIREGLATSPDPVSSSSQERIQ